MWIENNIHVNILQKKNMKQYLFNNYFNIFSWLHLACEKAFFTRWGFYKECQ